MGLLSKRNKSFTLLEATVALAIIAVFLLVPLSNYTRFDNNLQKTTFLKKFQSAWKYSLVMTKIKNSNIRFIFDKTYQYIEYYEIGKAHKYIYVPKDLRLESTDDVTIKRDGTIAAPFTVNFYDLTLNKNLIYTMQMEWGEIVAGKK